MTNKYKNCLEQLIIYKKSDNTKKITMEITEISEDNISNAIPTAEEIKQSLETESATYPLWGLNKTNGILSSE
ncbi:MAG TPA: hypothetical protein EYQ81_14040, partial [Sneathiellales bacterium]|nr:hypothetical protein [Sneathiellales bacterium]